MPVVTALRSAGRAKVAVELDGRRWRTLPLEAVVRAGLAVGSELDRSRARTLARERRRLAALHVAASALGRRDRSTHDLRGRLERRGIGPAERERTIDTLVRAGAVDDARFAQARAEALAERGYGDAAIGHDLERSGVGSEAIAAALAALEPERDRVVQHAERLGGGARAARALARRGFGEDALEHVVAAAADAELG
jgi:SOS response regulatory protein OraA/RecX